MKLSPLLPFQARENSVLNFSLVEVAVVKSQGPYQVEKKRESLLKIIHMGGKDQSSCKPLNECVWVAPSMEPNKRILAFVFPSQCKVVGKVRSPGFRKHPCLVCKRSWAQWPLK